MIFIPRKLFILYIISSVLVILTLGITAYFVFSPDIQYSPLEEKIAAEWFLFGAIVSICFLALIAARIFSIRGSIKKELGRIRSMSTYVSLSTQLKSRRLYELGPLLNDLFLQVSKINERQSLKMTAQNSLIGFLSKSTQAPIAVTDVFGYISYISDEFEKKLNTTREKTIGTNIENLISNVYIQNIVSNIETQRSYQKEQNDDLAFNVFPIYNREKEITYLLFDIQVHSGLTGFFSQGITAHSSSETRNKAQRPASRWNPVNRILGRFFNPKEPGTKD